MTKKLDLAPHLTVDASQMKSEEVIKEIKKLRPEGYAGWDGADGAYYLTNRSRLPFLPFLDPNL